MSGTRVPPITWTTTEAAAAVGCTTSTILEWARAEAFDAVRVDRQWLVDGGSPLAYANRPKTPRGGRPEPRVPASPLLRQIALRGGAAACGARKGSPEEKALERARVDGHLTVWMADQIAARLLGLTLWDLWGDSAYTE